LSSVETVAFAVSVLVVTYIVHDGRSNYLEGAMLLGLYLIIAIAFYAVPADIIDKVYHLSKVCSSISMWF
jgi:Ca2+:H+ antiporter